MWLEEVNKNNNNIQEELNFLSVQIERAV